MRRKTGEDPTAQENLAQPKAINWRSSVAMAIAGCVPMLMAAGIVVVPSSMGGVRISQLSGTLPGTLYPGVHFVTPLIDSVEIFDLRDHMFTAGIAGQGAKTPPTTTGLNVQSLEDAARPGDSAMLGVISKSRLTPYHVRTSIQTH
jgi:hypothetical protein